MNVVISRGLIDQILAHAESAPGEEVCGLLLGAVGRISEARPVPNVASDRASRFELDPAALIAAHKAARAGGPALLGHYHSHPDGNAEPSAADAEHAVPGPFWLIVAGGGAALFEAVADGPIHGRFRPVDICGLQFDALTATRGAGGEPPRE